VSIDGFIAEPDGNTNWMIWNWGPQTQKVVFSNTLTKSVAIPGGWDNAEIANGNLIDKFIN